MLHTMPQGHQPSGSGEEFLSIFTTYGHGSHLGHVTKLFFIIYHKGSSHEILVQLGYNGFFGNYFNELIGLLLSRRVKGQTLTSGTYL